MAFFFIACLTCRGTVTQRTPSVVRKTTGVHVPWQDSAVVNEFSNSFRSAGRHVARNMAASFLKDVK